MSAHFEWSILLPALLAGLLVLATHVPLGIQVLNRGIVFIDLAIAQIAGLGVIGAQLLGFTPHGIGVQPSSCAPITPSPAICAIAKSMNTMPRLST